MINGAEGGPDMTEAKEPKSAEEVLSQILQDPDTTVDMVVTALGDCGRNTEGNKIRDAISKELAHLAKNRQTGIDDVRTGEDIDSAVGEIMFWSDPENK